MVTSLGANSCFWLKGTHAQTDDNATFIILGKPRDRRRPSISLIDRRTNIDRFFTPRIPPVPPRLVLKYNSGYPVYGNVIMDVIDIADHSVDPRAAAVQNSLFACRYIYIYI